MKAAATLASSPGDSAAFQIYDQDGSRISHDDAATGVPNEREVASESACA